MFSGVPVVRDLANSAFTGRDYTATPAASMVEAIRDFCRETGQCAAGGLEDAGSVARCVFESLAFLYRRTLGELQSITGRRYQRIHIGLWYVEVNYRTTPEKWGKRCAT